LPKIISCLDAKIKNYHPDSWIFLSGDVIDRIGVILKGSVTIISNNENGEESIYAELLQGAIFGEVFVCARIKEIPLSVKSKEKSEVLFIDYGKIIFPCGSNCLYHRKLIENMLKLLASKNLLLGDKIEIMSKRSTREKLLCFLDIQRKGRNNFEIGFNREEMADYLCVNRSALSNELSKMQKEGIIKYKRNKFEII